MLRSSLQRAYPTNVFFFFPRQTCLLAPTFKRCWEACSGINFSLTFWCIAKFTALVQLLNTVFFLPFMLRLAPNWPSALVSDSSGLEWKCKVVFSLLVLCTLEVANRLLSISTSWQGNHYLGLVTALSEVSPLGLGLGLLLWNIWQDPISGATVVRHPRFPHYMVIIGTFLGRQLSST